MFTFFSQKIPMTLAVMIMVATVGFAYTANATGGDFLRITGGSLSSKFQVVPKDVELPSSDTDDVQPGVDDWIVNQEHDDKIFRTFGNASLDALGVFDDAVFRLKKDGQQVQNTNEDVASVYGSEDYKDQFLGDVDQTERNFVNVGYSAPTNPGIHNLEVKESINISYLDKNDPNWPDEYVCADDFGRLVRCGFAEPWDPVDPNGPGPDACNDIATMTDARDGTVYDLVAIGDQCWFQENLSYGAAALPVYEDIGLYDLTYTTSYDPPALYPFGNTHDQDCKNYYSDGNAVCGLDPDDGSDPNLYCLSGSPLANEDDLLCTEISRIEADIALGSGNEYEQSTYERNSANYFCQGHAQSQSLTDYDKYFCDAGDPAVNGDGNCSICPTGDCEDQIDSIGITCDFAANTVVKGCYTSSVPGVQSSEEDLDCSVRGGLYTYQQQTASGNLCPSGWHVPTDAEWQELETFYGMSSGELGNTGTRNSGDVGLDLRGTGATDFQAQAFSNPVAEMRFMTTTLSGGEAITRAVSTGYTGVSRDLVDNSEAFISMIEPDNNRFARTMMNVLGIKKAQASPGVRDLVSVRCLQD